MGEHKEMICHSGIIERIEPDKIFVRILTASACVSCQVKNVCNISEIKERTIELERNPNFHHHTGDPVTVVMEQSAGTWAVLLAYVIPVVILVMALFILVSIHLDEGMAALISLALLVPYYLGLYFFRDRLKKSFKFKLKANQPI